MYKEDSFNRPGKGNPGLFQLYRYRNGEKRDTNDKKYPEHIFKISLTDIICQPKVHCRHEYDKYTPGMMPVKPDDGKSEYERCKGVDE